MVDIWLLDNWKREIVFYEIDLKLTIIPFRTCSWALCICFQLFRFEIAETKSTNYEQDRIHVNLDHDIEMK